MQRPMALLALPVRSSRRRLAWTTLALLALTASGGADDTASNGTAGTVNHMLSEPVAGTAARVAATPAGPALEPAPPMPAALSPDGERPLLEAIARSYPFRKQIETKEQTGHVRALEAARIEANLDQARLGLAGIKRNLASLSTGGLPTYALIHNVASDDIPGCDLHGDTRRRRCQEPADPRLRRPQPEEPVTGELRTQQFRGWDEHEPLVVMSACQTALGRVFEGGTFGVARTWTNAGAGQVVASLWNVSDRATYRLMTRFVAGLQQGKAPELAMQAAQLETIKNYPNDPKMWASFTIIGKPTLGSGPGSNAPARVTGREPVAE